MEIKSELQAGWDQWADYTPNGSLLGFQRAKNTAKSGWDSFVDWWKYDSKEGLAGIAASYKSVADIHETPRTVIANEIAKGLNNGPGANPATILRNIAGETHRRVRHATYNVHYAARSICWLVTAAAAHHMHAKITTLVALAVFVNGYCASKNDLTEQRIPKPIRKVTGHVAAGTNKVRTLANELLPITAVISAAVVATAIYLKAQRLATVLTCLFVGIVVGDYFGKELPK